MAGFKEYQMLFSLNAKTESSFQQAFHAGSAEVSKLQGSINQLNKTQQDISSYQKQQSAIEKTKSKIDLYQTQLRNLQSTTASTSKEEAELANAIAAKEKQLTDSEKTLASQEAKLNEMGDALKQAGVNTENLGSASGMLTERMNALKQAQAEAAKNTQTVSQTMEGLSSILVSIGAEKALESVYGSLKSCSENAAKFQTSMASVKRTVGGDDNFIDSLGNSFLQLSTEIPITASELAEIASTAGQLGIAQEDVEGFTVVMAQLATTTDLTADNAATMLAQFANITGTNEYDRLGSTVAALGDSTATTASRVVEMSQGMAAAASIAGMSETDILAIAAAVGSLGIESQAGSTAMSQLITTLYKATETGDGLEEFASIAGMSAGQFKQAWGSDAVGAMNAFIQGLNDTERNGKSAMVILDELGITNVRQVKTILGLASAGNLLSDSISQANEAWNSNTALAEKAGIMYGTTESKLTMLQNAANNVSIAFGDALNPAVSGVSSALTSVLQPIAEFIEQNPAIVQGLTVTAGTLGLVTAAVAAYEAKTKLAAIATQVFGSAVSGHFGAILAVAGGLGALVTTIGLLSGASSNAGKSFEELQGEYKELSDSIGQNQNIIDTVGQYKKLSAELQAIGDIDSEKLSQKLSEIGSQVVSTQNQLDTANSTLLELQEKAGTLQETIDGTRNRKTKQKLQDDLTDINKQIEDQKDVIRTLEETHGDLVTQYESTSEAAQELKAKEDALKETKEQLAAVTGGVVASSEEEAMALYEAAAAAAEADNALRRQQLYENLGQQTSMYAQAIKDATAAGESYREMLAMVNTSQAYSGKSAEEINASYQELLKTLDEMKSAEGFDLSDVAYQSAIDQVEGLRNIFQGYSEDLNQYAGDIVSWFDSFSYLGTNETHWMMMLEEMNASVIEYKESLDGAKATQNEFLDGIADSVLSGAVDIKEVEKRLTEAWKDEENAEELVAGVVNYVNGLLEAQATAAEDAAAANEELASSSGTVNEMTVKQAAAVEDTIKQIEDLQKAYEDAYKAAYESMDGQFDLFENVSKISASKGYYLKKDLESYKASLKSQSDYMKDYAKNYEEVAKAVENTNPDISNTFMNQLADGSAESAQILANLAAAAPEDVAAIVQAYADAQAAREEYAASLAEAQTNFTETMSGLQEELTTTVQAMDFSDQASTNAKTALNAFVDAASEYIGPVSAAYARVAAAASAALKFNPTLVLPQGYASGTSSAEAGLRLVGEKGPELVMFKGGEQVLNAHETEKALKAEPIEALPLSGKSFTGGGDVEGSRVYNVNVSIPSINASGMDAGELMVEIADNLKDTIIETMEEYEEDQVRRNYR